MSDAAENIRDHFEGRAPEGVVSAHLFGSEAAGESHGGSPAPDAPGEHAD